jgi:hypothetical protein
VCCIFKKARGFDESSSESSCDDAHADHSDDDRRNNAYDRDPSKRNRRRGRRTHEHAHGESEQARSTVGV